MLVPIVVHRNVRTCVLLLRERRFSVLLLSYLAQISKVRRRILFERANGPGTPFPYSNVVGRCLANGHTMYHASLAFQVEYHYDQFEIPIVDAFTCHRTGVEKHIRAAGREGRYGSHNDIGIQLLSTLYK